MHLSQEHKMVKGYCEDLQNLGVMIRIQIIYRPATPCRTGSHRHASVSLDSAPHCCPAWNGHQRTARRMQAHRPMEVIRPRRTPQIHLARDWTSCPKEPAERTSALSQVVTTA